MLSSRRYLRHTMRYAHDYKSVKTVQQNFLRLCYYNKRYNSTLGIGTSSVLETKNEVEDKLENNSEVPEEVRKKLIFSEYLDGKKLRMGYLKNKIIEEMKAADEQRQDYIRRLETPVYSVTLENMMRSRNESQSSDSSPPDLSPDADPVPIHMPYTSMNKYETTEPENDETASEDDVATNGLNEKYKILYEKYLESVAAKSPNVKERYKSLMENIEEKSEFQLADDMSKVPSGWMTDYEHYDDVTADNWELNYGTPSPNTNVSVVPCGGCGALLHCKDSAIPGYLPSELFLGRNKAELSSVTCQRCHFMKHYNTSLAVNVSPDEYPKLLSNIKSKRAAVILLVDLMDFPCSIWPDILSIIGTKRPVFVVGNKIDLLPQDSKYFFQHVTECLIKAIHETGINKANVKHVALISAKTGFGIEELINKLYNIWQYKGHVYLIGCTNSGKSTLFNALLKSDYCKSQAVDVIQRATTSPWPGTTLNLLKFPILKPNSWRLSLRAIRLQSAQPTFQESQKLRKQNLSETRNLKHAELIGHIGRTFTAEKVVESNDMYSMGKGIGATKKFGIDINDPVYQNSHWCFDTPGTVQPEQVLNLLTTEELMSTLPKKIIVPRTFCLYPNQTLFLGGLGRVDFLNGARWIRVTVFASQKLPVTICCKDDANFVYDQLLRTKAFVVPSNDPKRLQQWPELKSKDFEFSSLGWEVSAADIVLSSAGWVAVTPGPLRTVTMRAWTPEGRGIYLRTPALLPHSVGLRGKRIRGTQCYYRGLPVYSKP